MQLNREGFEDLIGAYALDACDDDEIAAIDAYVASHPDAAAEVERLRAAAAWLGASGPLVPPAGLRGSLLERAVVPASGVDAYREVKEGLDAELAAFPADATEELTHNGLTVRQLVAHLELIDEVFLDSLTSDAPKRTSISATVIEDVTRTALPAMAETSFDDVVRAWQATGSSICDAAASAVEQQRNVLGYDVDDALVIRAFESWTHLDDIRRKLDRPGYIPSAGTLRSMADLSMRLVPLTLAATGHAHPGESMRFVLTGPGGRTWDVPLAPGETVAGEPGTVMTVDIVDWCNRFADRLDADALAFTVDGNEAFAAEVVAAAPVFTGL